jgi:hypothetical protein
MSDPDPLPEDIKIFADDVGNGLKATVVEVNDLTGEVIQTYNFDEEQR